MSPIHVYVSPRFLMLCWWVHFLVKLQMTTSWQQLEKALVLLDFGFSFQSFPPLTSKRSRWCNMLMKIRRSKVFVDAWPVSSLYQICQVIVPLKIPVDFYPACFVAAQMWEFSKGCRSILLENRALQYSIRRFVYVTASDYAEENDSMSQYADAANRML